MTDFDPTDDELVSAYLDGEVTPDEAAAVEARPEFVARAAELRGLRASLSEPLPSVPTEAAKDDMISAALGEFGRAQQADVHRFPTERASGTAAAAEHEPSTTKVDSASERPSGVADLAEARRRKNRRNTWLFSAAAAVLLAVAIPAALNNIGGGEDADTASSSSDIALEAASADDEGGGDSMDAMADTEDLASKSAPQAAAAESSDAAMSDADDGVTEAGASAAMDEESARPATTTAAAVGETDTAERSDADDDAAAAMDDSASFDDDVFAIADTMDELIANLEQPGYLEEIRVVSQEFGAPATECAGPDQTGVLARLVVEDKIVEVLVSAADNDVDGSMVTIVDRETCAALATVDR